MNLFQIIRARAVAMEHELVLWSTSWCFVNFWAILNQVKKIFRTLSLIWQLPQTQVRALPQSRSSRHLRTKNIKSTSSCSVHFCPVQFWPSPGQGGEGLWIWGSGNRLEMEPNTATRPDSRRIPPRAQGSNELGGFQLCNPQELHWIAVKLCLFVCWGEEDNNVQQRRSFQLPIPAITKHQSYIFNFGLSLSCL